MWWDKIRQDVEKLTECLGELIQRVGGLALRIEKVQQQADTTSAIINEYFDRCDSCNHVTPKMWLCPPRQDVIDITFDDDTSTIIHNSAVAGRVLCPTCRVAFAKLSSNKA